MNLSSLESLLGRQRFRQWSPLITQQFRLRHIYQILGFNFLSKTPTSYYFTLHSTSMSAPFYTSEKLSSSNPKWSELDVRNLTINSSISTVVLRIWQQKDKEMDVIILTWGINFSGLVYLGNKITDIQPGYFNSNTVIFYMRGGYFTSHHTIRTDLQKPPQFVDNINVLGPVDDRKVFRRTAIQTIRSDIRTSYNLEKLRKLHSLQVSIRNKSVDVQILRDKINVKCGLNCVDNEVSNNPIIASSPSTNIRYAPQLLTMNSLNKLLQDKPTKVQRQEMVKIKKEIEMAKFRSKLLSQERDKKSSLIRQLKQKLNDFIDDSEERRCNLMENYHKLSRESERLKEFRQNLSQHLDIFLNVHSQLQHRRRQLMHQLLFIYPIQRVSEKKYTINGIYLPNSDILADCSDTGLSVALGYIAHILTMCSIFLQVPLRYPVNHYGSRSFIIDNINPVLPDKEREFPLFIKGKEKMQFTYAVFLLNKNIAQLRWLFYMHTPELKATLFNLLNFLESYKEEEKDVVNSLTESKTLSIVDDDQMKNSILTFKLESLNMFSWNSNTSDPIFDSIKYENQLERSTSPIVKRKVINKTTKSSECGPGLSEILAIPEAFLNKQISSDSFKNFGSAHRAERISSGDCNNKFSDIVIKNENHSDLDCDIINNTTNNDETIEQGTDMLDPSLNLLDLATNPIEIVPTTTTESSASVDSNLIKPKRRISRSVGSYTDDDDDDDDGNNAETKTNFEIGSEPLLSTRSNKNELSCSLVEGQNKYLEKWLDSGPTIVYSNDNLYPEETLGTTTSSVAVQENPLTARTDALLNTKSFNLVKPKH